MFVQYGPHACSITFVYTHGLELMTDNLVQDFWAKETIDRPGVEQPTYKVMESLT